MSENLNEVEKLEIRPFTKFCMSIGAVPSSYLAGLSIEEQLLWLCSYLENEVIPTVNNNGESVEELQELFTELQTYVTNYFTNLDVQDEINTKLDAMAEAGTLATIINQEIFGEINTSINTINNTTIPNIQSQIDTINNTTIPGLQTTLEGEINATQRNALYIGNSYLTGVGSTGNNNGIYNRTKDMFNDTYIKTDGGIGFLQYTDHSNTFITMLQNAINDSNIPNDEITDIIIVSAWGDTRSLHESSSWSTYRSDLQTAIVSFMTLVDNNFTNIKRVACMLGESRGQKHIDDSTVFDDAFWVHNCFKDILPKNGMEYLGWIGFNIMLNSANFSSDHYHPSDQGYKNLATLFKTAYSGTIQYISIKRDWSTRPCGIISDSTIGGYIVLDPERAEFNIQELRLAAGSTPTHGDNNALLFDFGNNLPFSLPMPAGQTTNLNLQGGFTCTTQSANSSSFDASTNYMAKLVLQKSTDSDSTALKLVTIGISKTNSTSNLLCCALPCQISWSLSKMN